MEKTEREKKEHRAMIKLRSENNRIVKGVNREAFNLYCDAKSLLVKSLDSLVEKANNEETPMAIRVDILKWFVTQMIGNPKQSTELEAGNGIEIIVNTRTLNGKDKGKSENRTEPMVS